MVVRAGYVPTCPVLLVMALYAAEVCALDGHDTPALSFSAFGTVGVTRSSEGEADFTSSVFKPDGTGHRRTWSVDVDSLFAAQVTGHLTPRLSAVVQVIAEQTHDDRYRPHVEWANVRYELTPDFSMRVGRIALPTFLVADYRNVGYAYPWVRPPVEVYGLIPATNSDGVDASYRMQNGELASTLRASYGSTDPELPGGVGAVEAKRLWNLSYTGEYGPATLQIGYLRADLTVTAFAPLFDGFRQFGPQGVALADRYELDDSGFTFLAIGGRYDPGDWFVMGEWATGNSDSLVGERTVWYASAGYRWGKVTPYVTYSQSKLDSRSSDPGLDLSVLPPSLAGLAAGLNAGLNAALRTPPVQKSFSVGGRWDFAHNAAFKLQFDHIRLGDGSRGTLINVQPGFRPGGSFNVLSATIDFVFH